MYYVKKEIRIIDFSAKSISDKIMWAFCLLKFEKTGSSKPSDSSRWIHAHNTVPWYVGIVA